MTVGQLDIPQIETDRLLLRGWRESDVQAVATISFDEESTRFLGGVSKPWEPFRAVCGFVGHWQFRGFGFFAVEEKATGECLGWCGCWRPDGWPGNEIGYGLLKSSCGKGIATEAATASLRWAYEHAGWESAISCIDADNIGSQSVARKLGATRAQQDVKINDFTADIWQHLPPTEFLGRTA